MLEQQALQPQAWAARQAVTSWTAAPVQRPACLRLLLKPPLLAHCQLQVRLAVAPVQRWMPASRPPAQHILLFSADRACAGLALHCSSSTLTTATCQLAHLRKQQAWRQQQQQISRLQADLESAPGQLHRAGLPQPKARWR